MKNKSFTLIELLVVIAIIGLLASIVLVSLKGVREKARDARRKEEFHQIQIALHMYYDDNGKYPEITGWAKSSEESWTTLADALKKYISLPKDPTNNCSGSYGPWDDGYYCYAYSPAVNGEKYNLLAQLENISDDDRCEIKCWKYHLADPERPWCAPCPNAWGNWSKYLYSDH